MQQLSTGILLSYVWFLLYDLYAFTDSLQFAGAVIIGGVNYAISDRKQYEGPGTYVRKDI